MKAAVVTGNAPPRWSDFADPVATAEETLVTVTAAPLSPPVRARAPGQHYSSTKADAFVAGVDGVGRLQDGTRAYFGFVRSPFGAMAHVAPVRLDCIAPIPSDVDDVTAAAIANPAMSSYAALLDRAQMQRCESVLINGGTGAAGKLAIQIAKFLGAGKVIVTGRNEQQLEPAAALGADRTIPLSLPGRDLADALYSAIVEHDVSIVLDYLWGTSAEEILRAISRIQTGSVAPRIRFVQIGAASGQTSSLDASWLRSSGVELLGTGLRSVALPRLVSRIGEALAAVRPGNFSVATTTRRMQDVETAWNEDTGSQRLVFTV
ncbi:MAG: zinc-binding alcohol dehydrogenase family protein [Candidatus Eremiobacteraeota bacterium]|nr:zinc-binding alcohol dehydrogenase family protein [Candidatus Eremiobacteraeota bacterium]